eukprot:TRINITY_DN7010_c0_g1_i3.p1 TRINITY_DN7010_c0_g1~~TRINITY_DN7010_c0_g1_i3.p1  ORF type:complete len:353 (+),score=65.06 TRINITY_DN7010_c0_g1_i3:368-1426(+)
MQRAVSRSAAADEESRRALDDAVRLRAENGELRRKNAELTDLVRNWDSYRFDVIAREVKKCERGLVQIRSQIATVGGLLKKVTDVGLRDELRALVTEVLAAVGGEHRHMTGVLAQCLSVTERLTLGAATAAVTGLSRAASRTRSNDGMEASVSSQASLSPDADPQPLLQSVPRTRRRSLPGVAKPQPSDYCAGMTVIHERRGRGEVIAADHATVTVRFANGEQHTYKAASVQADKLRIAGFGGPRSPRGAARRHSQDRCSPPGSPTSPRSARRHSIDKTPPGPFTAVSNSDSDVAPAGDPPAMPTLSFSSPGTEANAVMPTLEGFTFGSPEHDAEWSRHTTPAPPGEDKPAL